MLKLLSSSRVIAAVIVSTTTIASYNLIALHLQFAIADTVSSSATDYTFLVTSDWHTCQQISKTYQEVYAFETSSFYINICQKGNFFFYSGEAKQSNINSIFIPAHPLKNGRGYQAKNGNVSYVILVPFTNKTNQQSTDLFPREAILTIKRNEQLVAVESSLDKYCHESNTAIAFDSIEQSSYNTNRIATIPDQWDIASTYPGNNRTLLPEIFSSNSRFDFYQVGGELHLLSSCF